MANIQQLKGSIVALITPFAPDGTVDYKALGQLIDFHLENQTDALLILGTTGESAAMSHEEDDEVCRFTVERVAGRVPVIAGSGSNSTQTMLEKSLSFQKLGADGLLLITPYYNKTNEEGMYQHFKTVADAVDIPCILYNVPGRTGCSISEDVVRRLAVHPNIMGIKEASGNLSYVAKIARYVGPDMIVPLLSLGASGVISVLANILPRQTHQMVMDYLEGRPQQALKAQLELLDVINGLFLEVNPIPVKEAMNQMGMDVGGYRQPLGPMGEAAKAKLTAALKAAGLV